MEKLSIEVDEKNSWKYRKNMMMLLKNHSINSVRF